MRRVPCYCAAQEAIRAHDCLVAWSAGSGVPGDARSRGAAGRVWARAVRSRTASRNIRQLTFGGENAEAYFSFDGPSDLSEHRDGNECDQIYTMNRRHPTCAGSATAAARRAASTTRTASILLYASTHLGGDACPPKPELRPRLRVADLRRATTSSGRIPTASNLVRLTTTPGYDAEATIAQGRTHRLHQRARRRHGDLLDERRRHRRAPADAPAGPGRRRVLLARRHADRVSRTARCAGRGARRLPGAAEEGPVAADVARDLRDESRRQQPAPGHVARQGAGAPYLVRPTASGSSSRRT